MCDSPMIETNIVCPKCGAVTREEGIRTGETLFSCPKCLQSSIVNDNDMTSVIRRNAPTESALELN